MPKTFTPRSCAAPPTRKAWCPCGYAANSYAYKSAPCTGSCAVRQDAVLLEGQQTVDAQPLSVTPAGTVDCASWLTEKAQRQTVYLCYWMETEAGCTPVSVLLFCKPKHFRFAAPELSLSVQEQEDAFILTLAAEHMAKYVWLGQPGL